MYIRAIRLAAEECLTLAAADITSSYKPLVSTSSPTGAFLHPIRQWFLQNLTDQTLWFSLDGETNNFPLPANGFFISDIATNQAKDMGFYAPINMKMYVKELGNPTTGSVYLTLFYGEGGA
jgi:hypothetical protein